MEKYGQADQAVSRTCVQTKVRKTPKAEMQVMENPKPREAIAIDLGSLPNTPRGNVCFLVIVDLGTKIVRWCQSCRYPIKKLQL